VIETAPKSAKGLSGATFESGSSWDAIVARRATLQQPGHQIVRAPANSPTTLTRAKAAVRGEKMITLGKRDSLQSRAAASTHDARRDAKSSPKCAPKFADRAGGYTRIIPRAFA